VQGWLPKIRYTNLMDMVPGEAQKTLGNEHVFCKLNGSKAYFLKKIYRLRDARGQGQFNLSLNIIGLTETVYIPLSLASGKKPTGFIYQIEGTAEGAISTAKISCQGEGITQITLGTLRYVKIPRGKTANFEMIFHIEGDYGREYKIVINRINYKLTPSDARYKKLDVAFQTKTLEFRK
jgi:hypothetical protein